MYGVAVKCSDGWQTNIKEILVGFISYQDANDYALEMNNQVEDEIQDDEEWHVKYEVSIFVNSNIITSKLII